MGDDTSLKAFLSRTEDAPSYPELQGVLFAVACAPEMVYPSEWIPFVFGSLDPVFDTEADAKPVLDELVALYSEINERVFEGRVRLPNDCRFRRAALSNLEEDAPVSQWSRGFIRGHTWLEESWDVPLPDEMDEELGAVLMTLSFFSSRRFAEDCLAEVSKKPKSLVELAETMRRIFSDAMASYAVLGRSIQQARLGAEGGDLPKIGRNDPCPCGSGLKYKKCCGAPH